MGSTVVAVAAIAFAVLIVVLAFGVLRWQARQHERILARCEAREDAWASERKDLLDRAMHVIDRTWEPPPYAREESLVEEPLIAMDGTGSRRIVAYPEHMVDVPGPPLRDVTETYAVAAADIA